MTKNVIFTWEINISHIELFDWLRIHHKLCHQFQWLIFYLTLASTRVKLANTGRILTQSAMNVYLVSRIVVSIVGSLRDREVACSASDRQGSNFESCVWRTVSSQSSHHPQEVLLAQFSLYVHKGGLKPDSFHFIFVSRIRQTDRYFSLT